MTTSLHNDVVMRCRPTSSAPSSAPSPTRPAARSSPASRTATPNVARADRAVRVSQPAISRHLKVLEGAGLISRSRRATTRLSHLEAEPLREATEWLARYQAYWEESHERLDALLAALQVDPRDAPRRNPAG